jgi:predicted enzyme related to lactoylglutathione lyase
VEILNPMTLAVTTLQEAIRRFEFMQNKYRQFGALDTEPDGVFQRLIADTFEGKEPAIPRSGAGWELYDSSMDCTEAAAALSDAAGEVVAAIENSKIRDQRAMKKFIEDYCWRVF